MEQGNFPYHQMFLLNIEPCRWDKAVVHVGDLMIPTPLLISSLDIEADNQHKTLIYSINFYKYKLRGVSHTLLCVRGNIISH